MPVTFILKRKPRDEPTRPAARYVLDGKLVTLTEAAIDLNVGVLTVTRHITGKTIDAVAIRALVAVDPPTRNRIIIARIASTFHGAGA